MFYALLISSSSVDEIMPSSFLSGGKVLRFDQVEVCGAVFTNSCPAWLGAGLNPADYFDRLLPLLDFYVFENPNNMLTARSRSVASYGWIDPWKKPTYLNHKVKDVSNNRFLYYSASSLKGMEAALIKSGLLDVDVPLEKEVACFYDVQNNQTLSCLYHLRNSFCHGRFAFFEDGRGDIWVALEDVSSGVKGHHGKRLSARMLLRFETIEKWKTLIVGGPNK